MPLVWNLRYPFRTEEDRTRFHRHLDALLVDPDVARVNTYASPQNPDIYLMAVHFREGVAGTSNPDISLLDLQFPAEPAPAVRRIRGVPVQGVALDGQHLAWSDQAQAFVPTSPAISEEPGLYDPIMLPRRPWPFPVKPLSGKTWHERLLDDD